MANYAYKRTGLKKLCMAGGVALNSVANGRILRETPFEDVYIQPAAGDSGGALGAEGGGENNERNLQLLGHNSSATAKTQS